MGEKMKVLIAYDGSDCANAALADLPRAGLPNAVEAVVFTVIDVAMPLPQPSSHEITANAFALRRMALAAVQAQAAQAAAQAFDEAKDVADRVCESLRAAFPGWEVRAEVDAGPPARAIIERAQGWPADLVVVGSHSRTALGRLIFGSVSHKVAAEGSNSVRVVRCRDRNTSDGAPLRLLVGFDGSPTARTAVRAVARRAWPAGCTARVVAVDEQRSPSSVVGTMLTAPATTSQTAEGGLHTLRAAVEMAGDDLSAAAGLHVTCGIRAGDAKLVLLEEAESSRADCIFVGSGGFSGHVGRSPLGSVSAALVKDAPCSVEVVRR